MFNQRKIGPQQKEGQWKSVDQGSVISGNQFQGDQWNFLIGSKRWNNFSLGYRHYKTVII